MVIPQSGRICILIAKPNAMARELLASAFNRNARFKVVAQAASGNEILGGIKTTRVDVALIDATLKDGPLSGIGTVRRMRESHPEVKPVVLLDSSDPQLTVDAFRAGARGVFCANTAHFKVLCKCVERVQSGQIWANSKELIHVMEAFAQLAPLRVVNSAGMKLLTKREEDVVRFLAEGLGNREIARQLSLSEHTIKNYLFRIYEKLGVASRVELVLYAVSSTKGVQLADAAPTKPDDLSENVA